MHLKKYFFYACTLFLFCGCMDQNGYMLEEAEGYATRNRYKLPALESYEEMYTISSYTISSTAQITNLSKQLQDRTSKWLTTGREKKPYNIWNDFFTEGPAKTIIAKLKEEGHDTILLENYYDRLGNLFKTPTQENEKEVISSFKKLQANTRLMTAFKTCLAARYNAPETIHFTKATLAYQGFLSFILNDPQKNNSLPIKLEKLQSDLVKWREDGHPTGQKLWERIEQNEAKLLKGSQVYGYRANQEAIKKSFRLIEQLRDDPYTLSYRDLLETLPHGIDKLENILEEVKEDAQEQKDDIKLLKIYLELVSSIIPRLA